MAAAVQTTLAVWAAFELVLRVVEAARRQGRTAGDRGTRTLIALALAAAIAGGAFLAASLFATFSASTVAGAGPTNTGTAAQMTFN